MLFLQLNPGEYLTIGDDIAVQVFLDSASRIRVAVKAPREMTILRGEVRERQGGKPRGPDGPAASPDKTARFIGFIRLTSRLKYRERPKS